MQWNVRSRPVAMLFLVLCSLLTLKGSEANLFSYMHIKKLVTAYAVAKALSGKRPTLVPVPIPIPIPIHQNEIIKLPISGGKTTLLTSSSNHNTNSATKNDLSSLLGLYDTSGYGFGLPFLGNMAKKSFGLSNFYGKKPSVKIISADSLYDGGNFLNSNGNGNDGYYSGDKYDGMQPLMLGGNGLNYGSTYGYNNYNLDMDKGYSNPSKTYAHGRKRKRRPRPPGYKRNRRNRYRIAPKFDNPKNHGNSHNSVILQKPPSGKPSLVSVGDNWKP